jgi:PAT family acetyl-CoA transporter-like MFS transporter 1
MQETKGLVKGDVIQAHERGHTTKTKPSLRKDLGTIVFLIFLYFLQAVPFALSRAMSLILGSRSVTYGAQGTFSFVAWPLSLKILWAPIVDTMYIKRFGRRKSWMIPLNLIIGIFMICFGNLSNKLLYQSQTQTGIEYQIYIKTSQTRLLV